MANSITAVQNARVRRMVEMGKRQVGTFHITTEFNLDKTKNELLQLLGNLDQAVTEVMEKYAQKTRTVMVNQFNRTAVYSRPSRKTGRLLAALDSHKVTRSGKVLTARIGDQGKLPFYWEAQESGSQPFDFLQKFVLVYRDGKPKFYSVRPAKAGTQNTISANPKSVGATNRFFTKHGKIEPINLYVSNPGIRRRDFIKTGRVFLFKALPFMFQEIISRAAPKTSKRAGGRGVNLADVSY